jgi:hypothetical protein
MPLPPFSCEKLIGDQGEGRHEKCAAGYLRRVSLIRFRIFLYKTYRDVAEFYLLALSIASEKKLHGRRYLRCQNNYLATVILEAQSFKSVQFLQFKMTIIC